MSPDTHDKHAWADLTKAVKDPLSALRYPALATIGKDARPKVRTVVLRDVLSDARRLEFHTDVRSEKWSDLARSPDAHIHVYCPERRLQLRFDGTCVCHGPDSQAARAAWAALPDHTRTTYKGGPPGIDLAQDASAPAGSGPNPSVFGVIQFHARHLDWVQLDRTTNLRAKFEYGPDGRLTNSRWVIP